ncbi:MAG: helix-turn-helix domain-containing protein [Candidatus Micrarchaeota archaeon]|mgnify:CR=1 FL=1
MEPEALEQLGLTKGEAKVYLALLRLGASKTGAIASEAGVSSSKVYKILDRLERKGMAGHVLAGGVRRYNALEPRRILDWVAREQDALAARREAIERMLPALEKQKQPRGESEASIYFGVRGVTNFYCNILDELKPGECYRVIGAGYGDDIPGLRNFFYAYHKRRAKKRIRVKMLANWEVRDNLVQTTRKHSEIRFLPQYLATKMTVVFYGRKVFVIILAREPVGFLLENEEAAKSFQAYFDAFWKIARTAKA